MPEPETHNDETPSDDGFSFWWPRSDGGGALFGLLLFIILVNSIYRGRGSDPAINIFASFAGMVFWYFIINILASLTESVGDGREW